MENGRKAGAKAQIAGWSRACRLSVAVTSIRKCYTVNLTGYRCRFCVCFLSLLASFYANTASWRSHATLRPGNQVILVGMVTDIVFQPATMTDQTLSLFFTFKLFPKIVQIVVHLSRVTLTLQGSGKYLLCQTVTPSYNKVFWNVNRLQQITFLSVST